MFTLPRPARTAAAAVLCLLLGAAAPPPPGKQAPGLPVVLSPQPRTWMDTAARRLVAQDMGEARQNGEIPLLLVGSAKLSAAADRPALFVQLQSPRECGSAGCDTQVFLWRAGRWSRVLDGVSGQLRVAPARTRGMADLVTDEDHYAWNGTAYRSTHPAPAIDLRPKR